MGRGFVLTDVLGLHRATAGDAWRTVMCGSLFFGFGAEIPSEPSAAPFEDSFSSLQPSLFPSPAKRFRWHLVEWGRHFPPNPRSSRCTTRPLSSRLRGASRSGGPCCTVISSSSDDGDHVERRQEVKMEGEQEEEKNPKPHKHGHGGGGVRRPRRAAAVQAAAAWRNLMKAAGSLEPEGQVHEEDGAARRVGVIRTPRRRGSNEREQERSLADGGLSRHSSTPGQKGTFQGSSRTLQRATEADSLLGDSADIGGSSKSEEFWALEFASTEGGGKERRNCSSLSSWEEHVWKLQRPADSPSPGPRFGHSLTCIGSRLFLFGGMRGDFYKNGGGSLASSSYCASFPVEGSGDGEVCQVPHSSFGVDGRACSSASRTRKGRGRRTTGHSPPASSTSPSSSSVSSPCRGSSERRRGRPSSRGAKHVLPTHAGSSASSGGSSNGRLLMNDVWMLYRDPSRHRAVSTKRQCRSSVGVRDAEEQDEGGGLSVRSADARSSGFVSTSYREDKVFDVPETRGWQWKLCLCKGAPPSPRSSHRAVSVGVHLIIFGGYGGRYLNSLHALNTGTLVWSSVDFSPSLPLSQRIACLHPVEDEKGTAQKAKQEMVNQEHGTKAPPADVMGEKNLGGMEKGGSEHFLISNQGDELNGREDTSTGDVFCGGGVQMFSALATQKRSAWAQQGNGDPTFIDTEKIDRSGKSFSRHASAAPLLSPEAGRKRYSLRKAREGRESATGPQTSRPDEREAREAPNHYQEVKGQLASPHRPQQSLGEESHEKQEERADGFPARHPWRQAVKNEDEAEKCVAGDNKLDKDRGNLQSGGEVFSDQEGGIVNTATTLPSFCPAADGNCFLEPPLSDNAPTTPTAQTARRLPSPECSTPVRADPLWAKTSGVSTSSSSVASTLTDRSSRRRVAGENKEDGAGETPTQGCGSKSDVSVQAPVLPIPKRMEAGLAFDEDRNLFLFGGSSRFRWQCAQHQ